MLHLRYRNVLDIGPLGVPETPSRMWYRQDTPKSECPWDVLGTPGGTVGQVGHWDNSQEMESLGCHRNSQWDSRADRTLGQLFKDVGVLGMSWGVPVGLWDIQDTRTTPKALESLGCPSNSLTIQWDLG